ncbi:MAG: hypothetical protein ACREXS_01860 [Gammaproteobacteria bacterium]
MRGTALAPDLPCIDADETDLAPVREHHGVAVDNVTNCGILIDPNRRALERPGLRGRASDPAGCDER